jgi:hypothetical protein
LAELAGATEPIDEELLAKGVLKLFTADQCDLLLNTSVSSASVLRGSGESKLIRHQASQGLPIVNRWHETVDLTPDQRRFLAGEAASADEDALRASGLLF